MVPIVAGSKTRLRDGAMIGCFIKIHFGEIIRRRVGKFSYAADLPIVQYSDNAESHDGK